MHTRLALTDSYIINIRRFWLFRKALAASKTYTQLRMPSSGTLLSPESHEGSFVLQVDYVACLLIVPMISLSHDGRF